MHGAMRTPRPVPDALPGLCALDHTLGLGVPGAGLRSWPGLACWPQRVGNWSGPPLPGLGRTQPLAKQQ